jgi:indole-3-acetate monooxygenase
MRVTPRFDVVVVGASIGGCTAARLFALQRRFRDAHTATAHFQVNEASFELPGGILLELPAETAML